MSVFNKIFGSSHEERLLKAIEDNNYDLAKDLVKKGVNINYFTQGGAIPLNYSLFCKDRRIFQLLVDSGANVNLATNNGYSPVIFSALLNDFESVKLLIKHGANIHQKTKNKWTALICASGNPSYSAEDIDNLDLKRLGLDAKNGIEKFMDDSGLIFTLQSFLEVNHYHTENDPSLIVKLLLSAGADPNESNIDGLTPLMQVARYANYKSLQVLLEKHATPNLKDRFGKTALLEAVLGTVEVYFFRIFEPRFPSDISFNEQAKKSPNIVKWINMIRPKFEQNREQCVDLLIKNGADVNVISPNGVSILMHAIVAGNLNIIRKLVESGADIKNKDPLGQSALFLAAICGNNDIINYLLSKGVDINDPLKDGETPLMTAVWNGHVDTVQLLLTRGANTNCKKITKENPTGETPLLWAEYQLKQNNAHDQRYQKIKELLKEAGAKKD